MNLRALTTFVEQHASWLDWMPPQAGYTAFLHLRDGSGAGALRARMAERGIFLLDGSVFESPDHLRIGFGLEEAAFGRALAVFGEELRDLTPSPTPAHASPSGDVILLAKDPSLGRAKTRLARDIGEEYAGELCTAFVRDSIALATKHARRLYLSFAPAEALATFQALAPRARCFAQPEAEFGTRLLHAFETAINDGARQPVLIGTDSPSLPSHLLDAAQRALLAHDVVIGPAEDGGYYLIGMNAPLAALFEDIDWSTDRVLSQTLNRVQSAGLSVFLLPHWYDVDTGGDLEQLAGDPLLGDHTRAALKMHRREEVAV